VPGDGLPLPVLIRGQVQLGRVGEQLLQLGDLLPAVRGDHVERLEAVVHVHAEPGPRLALVLGRHVRGTARQIPDVAHARLDDVTPAEIGGDLLRLGR
jgi:hypothetical protein